MVNLEDVYIKKDDLVFRNVGGEAMIIPIRGKLADMRNIYALTTVAEFVWKRLDENVSVENILDAIVSEFDVTREIADQDLQELFDDLLNNELISKV